MGYRLDLKNPKTYNEKLQWIKLYDRKKEYCKLVDKYEVRKYIENKIGSKYLVPMINLYDNVDEIDWEKLPNEFVLKCTNSSASVIICKDKSKINENIEKNKLKKWLNKNIFYYGREWPYKDLKPRIICEKLLKQKDGNVPEDYKIFCFDGEPKAISVHSGRFSSNYTHDIYDINWNKIDVRRGKPNSNFKQEKPKNFEEMLKISKILSQGLRHVRVDLYNLDGKIFFGELTFFTASGFQRFDPFEYDEIWGEWIKL
ncbi:TPA: glycosyl transferase [Clostridium perfringens]|nr:glycosyl transferase [Clostridium perfringens]